MVKQFPDVFNVGFTSAMEGELDKIEDGELGWRRVLEDFYGPFAKSLESVDAPALIAVAHDLSAVAALRCPECGGRLEPRGGFFGPFLACENHPKTCKYTRPLKGEKVKPKMTDIPCPLCGKPMVVRTGRSGEFLGCSTFPKCRGTKSMPTGVLCPKDGGEIVERRSKKRGTKLLRLRQRRLRFRGVEQTGAGEMPRVRLHRRRDEVHQGPRRLPQVHQVRQRVGRGAGARARSRSGARVVK